MTIQTMNFHQLVNTTRAPNKFQFKNPGRAVKLVRLTLSEQIFRN